MKQWKSGAKPPEPPKSFAACGQRVSGAFAKKPPRHPRKRCWRRLQSPAELTNEKLDEAFHLVFSITALQPFYFLYYSYFIFFFTAILLSLLQPFFLRKVFHIILHQLDGRT